MEACQQAELPLPEFQERSGGFVVTLNKTPVETPVKTQGGELGNGLGNGLGNELGNSKTRIIKEMRANPKVSAATLAEILNISTTAVEKHIKLLKDDGIIKRIDGTRGHWEIIDE